MPQHAPGRVGDDWVKIPTIVDARRLDGAQISVRTDDRARPDQFIPTTRVNFLN